MKTKTGAVSGATGTPARLAALLGCLRQRAGRRVVVLVDEYDKPVLDTLDSPEIARANCDFLRAVYGVFKDCDADIEFTLFAGVIKFSTAGLFSGLNNLIDITLDPRYAAICGYTDADLNAVFTPELSGLDRDEIRGRYAGYNWRGSERVYNPYDILALFESRDFAAHWFEANTPALLVALLERRTSTLDLDGMLASSELISTFDVGDMPTEALLFQTGYLTIASVEPRAGEVFYRLCFPNCTVRQSLRNLVNRKTGVPSPTVESARRHHGMAFT